MGLLQFQLLYLTLIEAGDLILLHYAFEVGFFIVFLYIIKIYTRTNKYLVLFITLFHAERTL